MEVSDSKERLDTWFDSLRQGKAPDELAALAWGLSSLPVPAEILVYTRDKW